MTFRYPDQQNAALQEVSFRIMPGERVGIIGRIGSGKSTVQKLLIGLYSAEQGAVLVDGVDVRQFDPVDLRSGIGAVLQDVVLMDGTVRENIAAGKPRATDAEVLDAAELAAVTDFVSEDPAGFELEVGEGGRRLSGGQRQAVALARALIKKPGMLLLDEPTSAMDNITEERVKANLARFSAGRTLLLVTHRSSLLSLVDRLILLEKGRVIADGPKQEVLELLKKRGGSSAKVSYSYRVGA